MYILIYFRNKSRALTVFLCIQWTWSPNLIYNKVNSAIQINKLAEWNWSNSGPSIFLLFWDLLTIASLRSASQVCARECCGMENKLQVFGSVDVLAFNGLLRKHIKLYFVQSNDEVTTVVGLDQLYQGGKRRGTSLHRTKKRRDNFQFKSISLFLLPTVNILL